ncbi:hypothetical protein K439DRAFT_388574 [Ramaria rubella]|nr:hypothetical protein K439DRAFT_388574 [Ramaria rubella]
MEPTTRPSPFPDSASVLPRPKRPKTTKACNACRKQKSRCERLAGDGDGCHRCGVIGIACVFDAEGLSTEGGGAGAKRPRPILPRGGKIRMAVNAMEAASASHKSHRESPDNSGLHVLANTTEMLSRSARPPPPPPPPPIQTTQSTPSRPPPTPKTPLSPETLSTVESTLFPHPRDSTSESESARFRADWRRWVAPLTLLQTLVRRNRVSTASEDEATSVCVLNRIDEKRLRDHFRTHYVPWLPAISLTTPPAPLTGLSPFLTTVIHATAARTVHPPLPPATAENLRATALHHVGQIFTNPRAAAAYPLVDALFALLVLVLWPLDAADDVALLVCGAKRLASGSGSTGLDSVDHSRLWYAICANETILTLGAGISPSPTSSPPTARGLQALIPALGPASALALAGAPHADVLLVLQTHLHKIVVGAIMDRGSERDMAANLRGGCSFSGPGQGEGQVPVEPTIPRGRDALLDFIRSVYLFLTRLGQWEIEFQTIAD